MNISQNDRKNASHRETHFLRHLGALAPAAHVDDDRRAFQETMPSPTVAKTGASRFWGYAPLTTKAPAGFGCQGPRRPQSGGAACLGLDGQRTTV